MVQVQDTRFHYNWVKKDGEYPSYDGLLPEFKEQWAHFQAFCGEEGLGEIKPNQWEITYVNHVPAGSLWQPGQLASLLPWIQSPASDLVSFEAVAGTWQSSLGEDSGRLHVKLSRAKHPEQGDLLVVDLTARGPVGEDGPTLGNGLSLGHNAIVFSFAEMTSDKAHREWERYQ